MAKKTITVHLSPEAIDALTKILRYYPDFSLSRYLRENICHLANIQPEEITHRGKRMALPKNKYANVYLDDKTFEALNILRSRPGGFNLRQYINSELISIANQIDL